MEIIKQQISNLLNEQELVFFQYRDLLTKPQWNLLKAIGLEKQVLNPTSMNFINKYKLGNPATVMRSLKALLDKKMIYQIRNQDENKQYFVYDLLLMRWLQIKYLY